MPKRIIMTNDTGRKKPTAEGVYIQDIKGRYYTQAEWLGTTRDLIPNGIAVINPNAEFLVALNQSPTKLSYGGNGKLLTGVTTTTNIDTAKTDYNGKSNTEHIISQLGAGNAPAAGYCFNYIFPNGQRGYLPAVGEWIIARDNKTEIDELLSLLGGGISDKTDYSLASTQYGTVGCYGVYWSDIYVAMLYKTNGYYTRPFGELI
ncbi:hypothetical protein [Parabacteroides chinchillae]|uniref:Uncharacterized protein n=1 Tax=Parabacteroides chinchillae TaxID=871327 RepID=A0A8G2BWU8_9BACT|nr:hypothetical protein [Parabacteroides chinchillae]SEF86017.1 hypothetical protein SAMN05444001_108102 [Parabacteroides chinchillae]